MTARKILAVVVLMSAISVAHAEGGIADMFRSITGALQGGKPAQQPRQEFTPTIGVRGMDEADAKAAAPANEDYVLMEGWAATKPEAEHAAAGKKLTAQTAKLMPAKAATPAGKDKE